MELREKVANIVFRAIMASDGDEFDAHDAAIAILAIPEIAEALQRPSRAQGGYWERTGTGKGARKWVEQPSAGTPSESKPHEQQERRPRHSL